LVIHNAALKKAVARLMGLSNDERTRLLYESRQGTSPIAAMA